MKIEALHQLFSKSTGISTDTRAIEMGTIFFTLKGENFNGNVFAQKAIECGANYVVLDEIKYKTSEKHILVENALETLQELAAYHRSLLKIPVIGITGTNGKTTTKELIYSILSIKFNTFATKGNFNNHIGVPLSLLSITEETEIAIIEMGANHVGEIAAYCKWVKPTLGLITNIGNAHLEGFGSFENIIRAKTELYDELKENKRIIFYNDDDDLIKELVGKYDYQISYGSSDSVDTQVKTVSFFPTVEVVFEIVKICSNLFGEYNASNISAAIAIASYFDITKEYMKIGLENYVPKNNRSEIVQKGTNIVILDAYNANPTSVQAALNSFNKLEVQNKIVIIGDMFELGKNTILLHQEITDLIDSMDFNKVVLVGEAFSLCTSENILFIDTTEKAVLWFKEQNIQQSTILIKGSRGMKMETIVA